LFHDIERLRLLLGPPDEFVCTGSLAGFAGQAAP
jgi:hypothetical protein